MLKNHVEACESHREKADETGKVSEVVILEPIVTSWVSWPYTVHRTGETRNIWAFFSGIRDVCVIQILEV